MARAGDRRRGPQLSSTVRRQVNARRDSPNTAVTPSSNIDPRLHVALELLSFAVVVMQENKKPGPVQAILKGLDDMSVGDDSTAHLIRLRALSLRVHVAEENRDFDQVAQLCEQAMALAGPEHDEYYSFASALARNYFDGAEFSKGYDVIATAIITGLDHHVASALVRDQLRVATFGDISQASNRDLICHALTRLAIAHGNMDEESATALCRDGPADAINTLLSVLEALGEDER